MKRYSRMTILLPWLICGLAALFYAYEYFLRITPSVMTTQLKHFYHIHDGALGTLSAYYYYIYTPMQLVAGALMDRYGPRRLLMIATLCCVIGSVLFAATPYLLLAEVGRFLIGFGSAFAFVGVLKLATIWLPRRHFAIFTGLATACGMLGAIVGDIGLTELVKIAGWQQTAYISAGFGVILAILIGFFVRDHKSFDRKSNMPAAKITTPEVLNGLKKIIRNRQMWIVGIIGGFLFIPASAFAELWGIPYLEHVHHFTSEGAATAVAMIFAGWAIGGPIYGMISERIRQRRLPLTFSALLAGAVMLIILYVPLLSQLDLYLLFFLLGVAASGQSIVFAVGRELGPRHSAGSSIAFINMWVMLGGVVMQPFIGYMLDFVWNGQLNGGEQVFTTVNYQSALFLIPVALFMAALLSHFVLKETHGEQSKVELELNAYVSSEAG